MNQLTELLGRIQGGDTDSTRYTVCGRLCRPASDSTGPAPGWRAQYGAGHDLPRARIVLAVRACRGTACRGPAGVLCLRLASDAFSNINSVRERIAQKRGGDWRPVTLSTSLAANIADGEDTVLKVDEALEDLEKADPRLAQVAQMRYFGGYSEQEIAETLDVTKRTVQRDWEKARLILAAALR